MTAPFRLEDLFVRVQRCGFCEARIHPHDDVVSWGDWWVAPAALHARCAALLDAHLADPRDAA